MEKVFSLGLQPLANDFCVEEDERAGFAPLEVLLCPRCGLAQLSVVVRPDVLYRSYSYVTSKSVMMKEHFARLWRDVFEMSTHNGVIEIGSNDGDFLKFIAQNGATSVLGIEPASNLAAIAAVNGIQTINAFFGLGSATEAARIMNERGIIFARHVFCHVDNWMDFMKSLDLLAGQETIVCIEVPYVVDQIKTNSFDQIYHEHLSYLSLRAFNALLHRTPFRLRKVLRYPIHGGAIVLVIQKGISTPPEVEDQIKTENLDRGSWQNFSDRSEGLIKCLGDMIRQFASAGRRVVGYGASAKSTVWINAMGLTRKELGCVYDCTQQKWYKFIPGTDIPVVHEGGFYVDNPDYAVMFAWNFAGECISKQAKWLKGGGHFIVPVPAPRLIGADSVAATV